MIWSLSKVFNCHLKIFVLAWMSLQKNYPQGISHTRQTMVFYWLSYCDKMIFFATGIIEYWLTKGISQKT